MTLDGQQFSPVLVQMQEPEEGGYRCLICREMIPHRVHMALYSIRHRHGLLRNGPMYVGWVHRTCMDDDRLHAEAVDRHRAQYDAEIPDPQQPAGRA